MFLELVWLLPMFLLIGLGIVPGRIADLKAARFRKIVAGISTLHLGAAVTGLGIFLSGWLRTGQASPMQISNADSPLPAVLADGTSWLMLTLVAFVGWVICRFSIRYLDSETHQGSYFRWLSLTVGAVSLLAISGDLVTLFVAWSLSSLGIHKLLTHYSDRPAARRAAWTKCIVSRVADVFLLAAGVLIFREFGTLRLPELFATVQSYQSSGLPAGSLLPSIGALLIAGAALKTAQFPFHTWLPETLEAPTPVSALMHAGIVNAGGYLLIRLSPLLAWSPLAMSFLAVLGAVTACSAATVMLTQTSIKKSLAWSTIAQMGFMMLQCGLGAFSAAMLHIIAHSLYKAHAFLNSGDVLNQAAATRGTARQQPIGVRAGFAALGFSLTATLAIYAAVTSLLGLDLAAKPGGYLLGMILCLGLTRWVSQLVMSRQPRAIPVGLVTTTLLSAAYVVSFQAVDAVLASEISVLASRTPEIAPQITVMFAVFVVTAFLALLVLENWLSLVPAVARQNSPKWLRTAYVHASNGFYIDAVLARTTRQLKR